MQRHSHDEHTETSSPARDRLNHGIALAAKWETLPRSGPKPMQAVALGTAVRTRRLAEAVRVLGAEYAYEARLQLRTMIELYFNYAWIRLKRPHSRATRFLRFQPIEKLKIAEALVRESPAQAERLKQDVRRLRKRRTSLRYLFRQKDKQGKRRWARDWTGGRTLAMRAEEVLAASRPSGQPVDGFLYTLYGWFSGTVHGSALSFDDVLTVDSSGVRAKLNSELRSDDALDAANAALLSIWALAAEDLRLSPEVKAQANHELHSLVQTLRRQREEAEP
jgi:hypothetical protein